MTEKELNTALNEWFGSVNKNINFWSRNPIAKTIKQNLIKWGNFKLKKRGDPPKAYKKKLYNIEVSNGYNGPFEE